MAGRAHPIFYENRFRFSVFGKNLMNPEYLQGRPGGSPLPRDPSLQAVFMIRCDLPIMNVSLSLGGAQRAVP
jgi:hypothetical protein